MRILWIVPVFLLASICQGAADEKAGPFVQSMLTEIVAIQNDPGFQGQGAKDKKRTLIRQIMMRNFDLDQMARDSLGPDQWARMTKAQQDEYASLFRDLFLSSYLRLVLDFLKKEMIEYGPEEAVQGRTVVRTTIRRVGDRIPVDYYLTRRGTQWQIIDVAIDGVSIVENYRRSFLRVIRQESVGALLKRMRLQQKAIAE